MTCIKNRLDHHTPKDAGKDTTVNGISLQWTLDWPIDPKALVGVWQLPSIELCESPIEFLDQCCTTAKSERIRIVGDAVIISEIDPDRDEVVVLREKSNDVIQLAKSGDGFQIIPHFLGRFRVNNTALAVAQLVYQGVEHIPSIDINWQAIGMCIFLKSTKVGPNQLYRE
jgi:hypothetical protein